MARMAAGSCCGTAAVERKGARGGRELLRRGDHGEKGLARRPGAAAARRPVREAEALRDEGMERCLRDHQERRILLGEKVVLYASASVLTVTGEKREAVVTPMELTCKSCKVWR
ncbi:hypothetical protein ACP70R_034786 [Stipagrostis hirtigluma subsp. patula]